MKNQSRYSFNLRFIEKWQHTISKSNQSHIEFSCSFFITAHFIFERFQLFLEKQFISWILHTFKAYADWTREQILGNKSCNHTQLLFNVCRRTMVREHEYKLMNGNNRHPHTLSERQTWFQTYIFKKKFNERLLERRNVLYWIISPCMYKIPHKKLLPIKMLEKLEFYYRDSFKGLNGANFSVRTTFITQMSAWEYKFRKAILIWLVKSENFTTKLNSDILQLDCNKIEISMFTNSR